MKTRTNSQPKRRCHTNHNTIVYGDTNSVSKIYKDIHQSRLCSAHLEARDLKSPTNNQDK